MPKKKQVRNAFFYFMLDYKARCERNGEQFANGMRDVQVQAGPEWDALPALERKKYEDRAKEEKAKLRGDTTKKYTNQHNTFEYVDKQRNEEEEAKLRMNSDIERTVRSQGTKKMLAEHKFYLIHVNYFCITEGECYHPAELAVAEFSLGEGITNVYHTIISPGQIPLGYRHDAMQKSETTHKIPLEPKDGERDFYTILKNIKKILEPGRNANGGVNPPMYTMQDNVILNTSISCIKSVMKNLCECTDNDNVDMYSIYSLEKLFFELNNTCAELNGEDDLKVFPNMTVACLELEKDVYNYTPNIACSFHYNEDAVENCSKSFVQRWAYLICDHCCQQLNVDIIPGKHVPEHSDVSYRQRKIVRQEEQDVAAARAPKPFAFIQHSQKSEQSTAWVPVQQPPLPKPKIQPTLARPAYEPIDVSDDNFPAIPIGRGRGKMPPRGGGRGSGPQSFADAMRSKK